MKKKLLSLVFAIALILPCVCFLSSCKDEDEATIIGIKFEIVNSDYNYVDESLQFTFGDSINITKSDFKVSLTYSDNTSKEITDYSLNLPSSLTSAIVPVGNYEVEFAYGNDGVIKTSLTVKVVSLQVSMPTFSTTTADIVTTYSKQVQNVTSFITSDSTNEQIVLLKTLLDSNIVTLETDANDPNSTLTATDAGEYYFNIKLNNPNYAWINGDSQASTIRVNWKIDKLNIAAPTVATSDLILPFAHTYNSTSGKYEANTQNLNINFGNLLPEEISNLFVIRNNSAKDAGEYTCTISLTEEAKKNYEFIENINTNITNDRVIINWEIEKMEIAIPSLVTNKFSYTGNTILPLANSLDFINVENPTNPINVGEYEYTISIFANKIENVNNYKWAGTDNLNEFSISYSIIRADFTTPTNINKNVEFEIDYSAGLKLNDIILPNANSNNSNVNLTADSLQYLQTNDLLHIATNDSIVDDEHSYHFAWKENSDSLLGNVDEKTYTLIYYYDYSNYNPIEISVKVNVKQAGIEIEPVWAVEEFAIYDVNGYENSINLNLPAENPLIDAPIISYKTYYKVTDEASYTEFTGTPKNVGFYKTVVCVAIDNNFYLYLKNDTSSAVTSLEVEWQITPQEILISSNWVGTESRIYDGINRQINFNVSDNRITNISLSHEYKAKDSESFVPIQSDKLTEVGEYKSTATFEYDTQNYILKIDENKTNSTSITWFIYSPSINCSAVAWNLEEDAELTFTGAHISPVLNVPAIVIIDYTYQKDGIPTFETVDVGTYTVTATLRAEKGYELSDAEASYSITYSIIPKVLTASDFSWNYSSPFIYDGEEKTVEVINNYEEYVEIYYDNNSSSNIGKYSANAYINLLSSENITIEDYIELNLDWEIVDATSLGK